MCPWPSHMACQNLSFPRVYVTRLCATLGICPGNRVLGPQCLVLKSEVSPQLWKVTWLELEGPHFALRAHLEG